MSISVGVLDTYHRLALRLHIAALQADAKFLADFQLSAGFLFLFFFFLGLFPRSTYSTKHPEILDTYTIIGYMHVLLWGQENQCMIVRLKFKWEVTGRMAFFL